MSTCPSWFADVHLAVEVGVAAEEDHALVERRIEKRRAQESLDLRPSRMPWTLPPQRADLPARGQELVEDAEPVLEGEVLRVGGTVDDDPAYDDLPDADSVLIEGVGLEEDDASMPVRL
jgi:hypothetical protein